MLRTLATLLIPRSVKQRLRRHFWWRQLALEWRTRSGILLSIKNVADWDTYNEVFVEGEYDFGIDRALAAPPVGRPLTVLDLGANVGFFCLRFADRAARRSQPPEFTAVLVEGSPLNFAELRERIAANPPMAERTRLIHGLAGARSGIAVMVEAEYHALNSIVAHRDTPGTEVPFVDLELALAGVDEVDLLKCDIQGAEESFIETYQPLLEKVRVAVFELHHELCDTTRCRALLQAAGLVHRQTLSEDPSVSVVCVWR
jgi:FkbM family methyltransferase